MFIFLELTLCTLFRRVHFRSTTESQSQNTYVSFPSPNDIIDWNNIGFLKKENVSSFQKRQQQVTRRQHSKKKKMGKKETTTEATPPVAEATTPQVQQKQTVSAPPNPQLVKAFRQWVQLFRAVHLAFHVLWLQVSLIVGRAFVSFVAGEIRSSNRKIVVMGDDAAVGVGDWVTIVNYPGINRRLNDTINKDVNTRLIGRGIFWNAFNGGKSGSTTEDWLPDRLKSQRTEARRWKLIGQYNLFESLFDPNIGEHRDADIVCMLLGMHDKASVSKEQEEDLSRSQRSKRVDDMEKGTGSITTFSPENYAPTRLNLKKILVELVKRNKCVLVATIPISPEVLSNESKQRQRDAHLARNDAIRLAVQDVQALLKGTEREGMVQLVDAYFSAFLADCFRFGGLYLGGRGYDKMTELFMEKLPALMRAVDKDRRIPTANAKFSLFI